MRTFLKIIVFLGIALFVIAIAKLFTNGSGSSSGVSDPPTEHVFQVTSGDKTYFGAISSDVGVAILKVGSGPYFAGFGEPVRADGKFIFVAVAVQNKQNTAITMNPSLFEILDTQGNVYSASEKSMEVDNDLFLAQINPGVTKVGQIVFDVPSNLDMESLRLRFHGGMMGESATLSLAANVTSQPAPAPSDTPTQPAENRNPIDTTAAAPRDESVQDLTPPTNRQLPPQPSDTPQRSSNANDSGARSIEQGPPPPTGAADSRPKNVSVGETPDEVISIMGPPSSVTTGAKVIYTYPHLQLIFTGGRVTDMRPY